MAKVHILYYISKFIVLINTNKKIILLTPFNEIDLEFSCEFVTLGVGFLEASGTAWQSSTNILSPQVLQAYRLTGQQVNR